MNPVSWLRGLRRCWLDLSPQPSRQPRPRQRARPSLEVLEDRVTPAPIPVGPRAIDLIAAIGRANSDRDADTLILTPNTTYTLTRVHNYWYGPNGLPPITGRVTIIGREVTIQRSAARGTPDFRFFFVSGGANLPPGTLTLKGDFEGAQIGLELKNGSAVGGNGSAGGGGGLGAGGAIFNMGRLNLTTVRFTGNRARGGISDPARPFGIGKEAGGGIGSDADALGGGGFGPGFPDNLGGNGDGGGGGFIPGANARFTAGGGLGGFGGSFGDRAGGRGGDGGDGGRAATSGRSERTGRFGFGGASSSHPPGAQPGIGGNGGGVGGGGGGGPLALGDGGGGGFGGGGGGGGLAIERDGIQILWPGGPGGFGGGGGGGGGGGPGGFGGGDGGNNNQSDIAPGGGGAGMGGAIFNLGGGRPGQGTVRMLQCVFVSNTARGGAGGRGAAPGRGFGGALFNLNGSVVMTAINAVTNTVASGGGPATDQDVFNLAYGNNIITGAPVIAQVTFGKQERLIIVTRDINGRGNNKDILNPQLDPDSQEQRDPSPRTRARRPFAL